MDKVKSGGHLGERLVAHADMMQLNTGTSPPPDHALSLATQDISNTGQIFNQVPHPHTMMILHLTRQNHGY